MLRGNLRHARVLAVAGLLLAIAAGAALRLLWSGDIEYKRDEKYTFDRTQNVGRTEPFPWFGMPTSAGPLNPGFSVWAFIGVARLLGVTDPPGLARAVALCSILALALYPLAFRRLLPAAEREPWDWGVALMALNPVAVLLHRKIWPPCLFPLLNFALLGGWLCRGSAVGALVWGIFGPLLGQLHMPGFFFAAGFVLWALLFDRRSVRWSWWLLGSVLGTLPMIPWLLYLFDPTKAETLSSVEWGASLRPLLWLRWVTQPFALTLQMGLGDSDFKDFLRYPLLGGHPTYLTGGLNVVLLVLFIYVLAAGLLRLWRARSTWGERFVGRSSVTAFTLAAAWWGYGSLSYLSFRGFHWYYLLVAMPLIYVWVARWVLASGDCAPDTIPARRRILLSLCISECLLSLSLLHYIHVNPRDLGGGYGTPYRAQHAAEPEHHAQLHETDGNFDR